MMKYGFAVLFAGVTVRGEYSWDAGSEVMDSFWEESPCGSWDMKKDQEFFAKPSYLFPID